MKKNNIHKLLAMIEQKPLLSGRFHPATNNKAISQVDIKDMPKSWTKINFKTYPAYPELNKIYLTIGTCLEIWQSGNELVFVQILLSYLHSL